MRKRFRVRWRTCTPLRALEEFCRGSMTACPHMAHKKGATFSGIVIRKLSRYRSASVLLAAILWIPPAARAQTSTTESTEQKLKNVAAIHGAAGVFAVAGYRMGERALRDLGLGRGSFAIEVVHHT